MFAILLLCATVAAFTVDPEYEKKRLALQNPDLVGGDMAGITGFNDTGRSGIPGHYHRWPNAVVPFVIDQSLSGQTNLIYAGMRNFHDYTCIRFVPRQNEYDYVTLYYGQGCWSMVGRVGGQQSLSLGDGCLFVGTVIHELGHAVGFYHEQNRSDRDDYLWIYFNNIVSGLESNFQKFAPHQNILYNSFDHHSIMIYGNDAFSTNGYWTMEAKSGEKLYHPFDKNSMTWSDINRVNKMYNC